MVTPTYPWSRISGSAAVCTHISCGVCAAACPRKAIVTRHYRDDQLVPKVDVLFGDVQFETAGAAAEQVGEQV